MKKLLAGLLAAVLLTAPAFGDDTVWDSLEDRYYEDISRTETDITLRFLEEGDQLDWSRAVRRYHMEDSLLTRSGVDAFLTAVRSGELLSSRISYDERLMVFVEQADGTGGTAVVNPRKGELVGYLPGDEGEMFVMELTGGLGADICAGDAYQEGGELLQFRGNLWMPGREAGIFGEYHCRSHRSQGRRMDAPQLGRDQYGRNRLYL